MSKIGFQKKIDRGGVDGCYELYLIFFWCVDFFQLFKAPKG